MNWVRLVAIMVGAGVVTSLTDWFFAGDWIHRRYTYPEIWRQGGEGRAIALTSPLPLLHYCPAGSLPMSPPGWVFMLYRARSNWPLRCG